MWVVLPVKRFSEAKSRLAAILSEAERESLTQAMLNDVLHALGQSRRVSGIVVISRETRARYAVERIGGLFTEESGSGLSSAIAQGGAWLAKHGQRDMLMIPGDVPLVSSSEIDEIINLHQGAPTVTIAPDREHNGTNALAVSPTNAIKFAYGAGSFSAHKAAAEAAGIEPRIVHLPGFALDVDNPMDLRTLLTYDSETESLAYLSDSGIARRVLPRHNGGLDNSDIVAASRLV